jgi:non-heme chloroperoxidase
VIEDSASLASGVRLSYARSGTGSGGPVVMFPGPTDSWPSYEPTLRRLPPSIDAIAVSPRGHGGSDKPPAGYAVTDFARDTVELLDALDVDRAVLVGHSGSCLTMRRVAIDHPERVSGLVLEASPATLVGNEGLQGFVESVVEGLEDPIDPGFAREWVGDTSGLDDAAEIDRLVTEVLKVPARVWKATFSDLLRYDDSQELAAIRAPTLLIWGDADALVDRVAQEALRAALADATLLVYEGVGHAPRWEARDRFAADLAAFVARP